MSMKTHLIISAALFSLFTSQAYAVCENSKTLFFCNTQKGKQIVVCDSEKTIDYSFGKMGKPELQVKAPRDTASTFQWAGIGSTISYSVDIPNGDATYNVFWSADKNTDEHAIEAGVNVFIKKELKTTVKCSNKGLVNNMEGVNLKASE
ncbi:hypothetical protein DOJK_01971 [Patescibacteria group bacterium]|nr:hypothetical protein DOJK_01971 [Patescibacteria group bacterium]